MNNRAHDKKWTTKNPEYRHLWWRQIRVIAFKHYGNGRVACACCGIGVYEFLSIDHINGGGRAQRRELGLSSGRQFLLWLRRQGWPPGYQTLCHNCNQAKGYYGLCPHQRWKQGENLTMTTKTKTSKKSRRANKPAARKAVKTARRESRIPAPAPETAPETAPQVESQAQPKTEAAPV